MSKVKFVLNSKGVTELMKSPEMAGVISDACNRVAGAAQSGSGCEFEPSVQTGKSRVQGRVRPVGAKSYYKTLGDNTLQKALGSVKV